MADLELSFQQELSQYYKLLNESVKTSEEIVDELQEEINNKLGVDAEIFDDYSGVYCYSSISDEQDQSGYWWKYEEEEYRKLEDDLESLVYHFNKEHGTKFVVKGDSKEYSFEITQQIDEARGGYKMTSSNAKHSPLNSILGPIFVQTMGNNTADTKLAGYRLEANINTMDNTLMDMGAETGVGNQDGVINIICPADVDVKYVIEKFNEVCQDLVGYEPEKLEDLKKMSKYPPEVERILKRGRLASAAEIDVNKEGEDYVVRNGASVVTGKGRATGRDNRTIIQIPLTKFKQDDNATTSFKNLRNTKYMQQGINRDDDRDLGEEEKLVKTVVAEFNKNMNPYGYVAQEVTQKRGQSVANILISNPENIDNMTFRTVVQAFMNKGNIYTYKNGKPVSVNRTSFISDVEKTLPDGTKFKAQPVKPAYNDKMNTYEYMVFPFTPGKEYSPTKESIPAGSSLMQQGV